MNDTTKYAVLGKISTLEREVKSQNETIKQYWKMIQDREDKITELKREIVKLHEKYEEGL